MLCNCKRDSTQCRKDSYGKGQIGCSFLAGHIKVLDNVITSRFEKVEIGGTERGADVTLACGES